MQPVIARASVTPREGVVRGGWLVAAAATASAYSVGHQLLSTVWNIARAADRCGVRPIGREAPGRGVVCSSEGAPTAERRRRAPRWGKLVTAKAAPSRGPLLAARLRDNVRFGAAVYGSFLVASVVGVAFEAGQDARVMTTTAFGLRARLLACALVVGGHRRADLGRRGVPASRRSRRRPSRVAAGRSGRRSHGPPRPCLGRRVVARDGRRARARRGGPPDHRVGTGRRPSRRMDMAARRPLRRGRRSARHRATAAREVGSLSMTPGHELRPLANRVEHRWSRTSRRGNHS